MGMSYEDFVQKTNPPSPGYAQKLTDQGYSWNARMLGGAGDPCLRLESCFAVDIEVHYQGANGIKNLIGHYGTFQTFVDALTGI